MHVEPRILGEPTLGDLRQRDGDRRIRREGVVERLRREEVSCTRVRVCLLQVDCDIEGVAEFGPRGGVFDNGEGVEVAAVGEFATRGDIQAGADFGHLGERYPGGFVRDLLEVESLPGFPWVGRAAVLLHGGQHGYVVERYRACIRGHGELIFFFFLSSG